MAYVNANGVVLARTRVGDNDAILTVYTDALGIIKVSAKGIKSLKNKSHSGATLFSYSSFVLRPGKTMYYLVSAELIMSFYSLSANIEMLAFATYIADITVYSFTDSDPEPSVLSLLLNTFYLLSKTDTDPKKVKNVYELKMLYYMGVGINTSGCLSCGKDVKLAYFTKAGGLLCENCKKEFPDAFKISADCEKALKYITESEDKKAFSFKVSKKVMDEIEYITDTFLSQHIDKKFYSLTYLNNILGKESKL